MTNKYGKIVIAVDGTSASGKSTLSEELAETYGMRRLEYSLFFRIIAMHMIEQGFNPGAGIPPTEGQINEASHFASSLQWDTILKLKNDDELHSIEVSRATPYFAGIPSVCKSMDTLICTLIENSKDKPVIVEGRTIGKYVYPAADLKLFVDADLDERAGRRAGALRNKGKAVTDEDVKRDLAIRDQQDMSRDHQPTGFDSAVHHRIDTTGKTPKESLSSAIALIQEYSPQFPLSEKKGNAPSGP